MRSAARSYRDSRRAFQSRITCSPPRVRDMLASTCHKLIVSNSSLPELTANEFTRLLCARCVAPIFSSLTGTKSIFMGNWAGERRSGEGRGEGGKGKTGEGGKRGNRGTGNRGTGNRGTGNR